MPVLQKEPSPLFQSPLFHKTALEKAEAEYSKYRQKIARELTQVEREFFASMKAMQKRLEGEPKNRGD
ncbi:MAG: hypothetical protein DDT20_01514 [Firmicutes bacterium]|nr:hypothetical protein [Bacillota bacterium]